MPVLVLRGQLLHIAVDKNGGINISTISYTKNGVTGRSDCIRATRPFSLFMYVISRDC